MAHRILHAGCGFEHLPFWLKGEETKLDINSRVAPDIVASMTDMGDIGPFNTVYCSHALEHLFPHDVPVALSEFFRVLVPLGLVLIFVPDLEDVRPTDDILYESDAGPIAGLDLFYGHRAQLEGSPWMAHHTGFIKATLREALEDAGFGNILVQRLTGWNLMGVGSKPV
jgi:hypothetical protein